LFCFDDVGRLGLWNFSLLFSLKDTDFFFASNLKSLKAKAQNEKANPPKNR
jgi:hypothetical protein